MRTVDRTLVVICSQNDRQRLSETLVALAAVYTLVFIDPDDSGTAKNTDALVTAIEGSHGVLSFATDASRELTTVRLIGEIASRLQKPSIAMDAEAILKKGMGRGAAVSGKVTSVAQNSPQFLGEIIETLQIAEYVVPEEPEVLPQAPGSAAGSSSAQAASVRQTDADVMRRFREIVTQFERTTSVASRGVVLVDAAPQRVSLGSARFLAGLALVTGIGIAFHYREWLLELIQRSWAAIKLGMETAPALIRSPRIREDTAHILVMSPVEVRPGDRFYVQVSFAVSRELRAEYLRNKRFDPDAELVPMTPEDKSIALEGLKVGDKLVVQVSLPATITVEGAVRLELKWSMDDCKAVFALSVSTDCPTATDQPLRVTIFKQGIKPIAVTFNVRIVSSNRVDLLLSDIVNRDYIARAQTQWFFSYSGRDIGTVRNFSDAWKKNGTQYWIDREHLYGATVVEAAKGSLSNTAVDKALRNIIVESDGFMLFWSENAKYTDYVEKEARIFIDARRGALERKEIPPLFDVQELDGPTPEPWPFLLELGDVFFAKYYAAQQELRKEQVDVSESQSGTLERKMPKASLGGAGVDSGATFYCGIGQSRREKNAAAMVMFRDGSGLPMMIVVGAGSFQRGSMPAEEGHSANEGPVRDVHIRHPFAVGIHPVTVGEFKFAMENGLRGVSCWPLKDQRLLDVAPDELVNLPMTNVGWRDASEYALWLTRFSDYHYRFLNESEWEYCCRAGSDGPFSILDGMRMDASLANFDGRLAYSGSPASEFRDRLTPVGSFPPNAYGIHDMHGNVWEWVRDQWHDNYVGAPVDGSAWIDDPLSNDRVVRGGSYKSGGRFVRCASRGRPTKSPHRLDRIGFRVARTLR